MRKLLNNEKAETGIVIDVAIGLTIVLIVLGYIFAPVGSTGYTANSDITYISKNATNNSMILIAPNTYIFTTLNNASSNSTYTLYYGSNAVGTYLQNISTNTARTTDGGTIYLNFTSISAGFSDINVGTNKLYGTPASATTIWNAILPITLAALILAIILIIKKVSQ